MKCSQPHQKCINLPGSYRCDCEPGYVSTSNGCEVQTKGLFVLLFHISSSYCNSNGMALKHSSRQRRLQITQQWTTCGLLFVICMDNPLVDVMVVWNLLVKRVQMCYSEDHFHAFASFRIIGILTNLKLNFASPSVSRVFVYLRSVVVRNFKICWGVVMR